VDSVLEAIKRMNRDEIDEVVAEVMKRCIQLTEEEEKEASKLTESAA
jgi:hypothetical protein